VTLRQVSKAGFGTYGVATNSGHGRHGSWLEKPVPPDDSLIPPGINI